MSLAAAVAERIWKEVPFTTKDETLPKIVALIEDELKRQRLLLITEEAMRALYLDMV